jgi:hypothetical protein
MKKYSKKFIYRVLLSTFLISSIANAGLIDAIAIKVNNEIITLVEIDHKMQVQKLDKQTAVNLIIDEMLFRQEVKKNRILVSNLDIEEQLSKIASSNNMTLDKFKQVVKAQTNYDIYIKNIQESILKAKLSRKILAGNLRYATDEDMKIYYENNQNLFTIANKIDVIRYISRDQNLLAKTIKVPMFFDASIEKVSETIDIQSSDNNIKYLLNGVKKGKFTKIVQINNGYMMYFIKEKKDIKILSYKKVKNKIFEIIMKERENKSIKSYFTQVRLTANIKVIR